MGKEIERKFRVRDETWREHVESKTSIRQGYLSVDKERTVRVRVRGDRATVNIKGITVGATRTEYEYEIPAGDANEILERLCLRPIIEKTRHLVPYEGRTWEVDELHGDNEGLVVAEIELDSEDEEVRRPEWAGDEVTDDPRFYNANLVGRPFNTWS